MSFVSRDAASKSTNRLNKIAAQSRGGPLVIMNGVWECADYSHECFADWKSQSTSFQAVE